MDERRVNRLVPVRMVIAHCLSHDLGAFEMLAIGHDVEVIHRVQNPPLGRLEAVASVRQGARNDHRHRIIKKRILDLIGDVDLGNLFVGGIGGELPSPGLLGGGGSVGSFGSVGWFSSGMGS